MSLDTQNQEVDDPASRLARLIDMANAIAGRLTPEQKAINIDAELYDANGLPR